MNRAKLLENIVLIARLAKAYGLPIVLSIVNVAMGANKNTVPVLKKELADVQSYANLYQRLGDKEFVEAVKATRRRKLIMTALWTEVYLTFPTIDALSEGFEVYPVADTVGGTSLLAHETTLHRVEQAGANLASIAQITCELQRDWSRKETVPVFVGVMRGAGIFLKLD